ncbi:WD40 repeat domain-containing protein [Saccharothrix sp.]|uniref:WD40 repeat domain-containing protein n=1 Tax=Saccharothrix sp. TaxID=1873460 RepID=UPI002810D3B5|nr:WD40 repeat domain-containing protein [Saccharothrix sp.]
MRTALLIATDTYADPTFRALRAPALDAVELDGVLADPAVGEFRTEVLLNRSAQEVRQRVNEVFAAAGVDDLVRSADPSLRAEGVRVLRTRAEAGDTVSAQALRLLAASQDQELSAAASAALGLPVEQPVHTPGAAVLPHHAKLGARTTAVAFTPDSSLMAAGGRVLDTSSWLGVGPTQLDRTAYAFSPDGRLLAVSTPTGASLYSTASWTVVTKTVAPRLRQPVQIGRPSFSHDGRTLVLWVPEQPPALWVAVEDQWQHRPLRMAKLVCLHVAAAAPKMATLSVHNEIQVWDTETRRPVGAPLVPETSARAVALSPDGRLLAVAEEDRTSLRRTADHGVVATLPRGTSSPTGLAFSPDGRLLATSSDDGLHLWSVPAGRLRQTVETYVRDVVFSPDLRLMAGVARNGVVWLWAVDEHDLGSLPEPPLPPTAEQWQEVVARARRLALIGGGSAFAVGFGASLLLSGFSWLGLAIALGVGVFLSGVAVVAVQLLLTGW